MSSALERRTRRKGPAFRNTLGPSTPSSWNNAWRVSTPAARITAWESERASEMLRAATRYRRAAVQHVPCCVALNHEGHQEASAQRSAEADGDPAQPLWHETWHRQLVLCPSLIQGFAGLTDQARTCSRARALRGPRPATNCSVEAIQGLLAARLMSTPTCACQWTAQEAAHQQLTGAQGLFACWC